jgi:hypothetical protein
MRRRTLTTAILLVAVLILTPGRDVGCQAARDAPGNC